MKETTAVYPGTFDPMTKGHFDLICRSASLFDRLIVAVAGISPKPTRLFGIEERMEMVREAIAEEGLTNVEVKPLDCLLVEFCRPSWRRRWRPSSSCPTRSTATSPPPPSARWRATAVPPPILYRPAWSATCATSSRHTPSSASKEEPLETPARLTVDLGRLREGRPERLQGTLPASLLEIDDLEQLRPAGPLAYDIEVTLLPGGEALARGALRLPCQCVCRRCGRDFLAEFAEEDFCETLQTEGQITWDLTESAREGIILVLPSYPICGESCKGVCPHCGKNLNRKVSE